MKLSEQTKIEAQIGFTAGILIGAFGGWIAVLFFAQIQWYYKLFTSIGSIGILGSLIFALIEQIKMRRNFLLAMAEMNKLGKIEKVQKTVAVANSNSYTN